MYFILPYPDSVNNHWRYANGRFYISKAGIEYRKKVNSLLGMYKLPVMTGDLSLQIFASPPDKRRRDIDNIGKAILDALTCGGLYKDDAQVKDLAMTWVNPSSIPKVLISVIPLFRAAFSLPEIITNLKDLQIPIYGLETIPEPSPKRPVRLPRE